MSLADSRPFAKSGVMSRPAGVAGILGSTAASDKTGVDFYGSSLKQATILEEHALRRHTPYAEVVPAGWTPVEALVKPTAGVTGAGVVSAGSIDNTYTVMPLENRWGKARELSVNEIKAKKHTQATDLVIVAKGAQMPPPAETVADMPSIRPMYSKTIPVFHGLDPQRCESGFVRTPNIVPGSKPPPVSPLVGLTDIQGVPADFAQRKLAYDQSLGTDGRVPVAKKVYGALPKPLDNVPEFVSKPAGLPGGLSLIPRKK